MTVFAGLQRFVMNRESGVWTLGAPHGLDANTVQDLERRFANSKRSRRKGEPAKVGEQIGATNARDGGVQATAPQLRI